MASKKRLISFRISLLQNDLDHLLAEARRIEDRLSALAGDAAYSCMSEDELAGVLKSLCDRWDELATVCTTARMGAFMSLGMGLGLRDMGYVDDELIEEDAEEEDTEEEEAPSP
jgi:hypothetical protein